MTTTYKGYAIITETVGGKNKHFVKYHTINHEFSNISDAMSYIDWIEENL